MAADLRVRGHLETNAQCDARGKDFCQGSELRNDMPKSRFRATYNHFFSGQFANYCQTEWTAAYISFLAK